LQLQCADAALFKPKHIQHDVQYTGEFREMRSYILQYILEIRAVRNVVKGCKNYRAETPICRRYHILSYEILVKQGEKDQKIKTLGKKKEKQKHELQKQSSQKANN